ncbi:MAG: HIT domain-containing protein [Candidatus Peregrinibacteria bacterium]
MHLIRRSFGISLLCLAAGILIGGFLFSDVQPRSFLAIHRCAARCWHPNELAGLIGSVITQKFSGVLPVVLETDWTIVIESPVKQAPVHFVIIPKRDIRDASEFTTDSVPYLVDAYAVMRHLINEYHLTSWQIFTNGPSIQHVTFLHFHLLATPDTARSAPGT